VEENNHEQKNNRNSYQKKIQGDKDAERPETYEGKSTGIESTERFTDEEGGGIETIGDLPGGKKCGSYGCPALCHCSCQKREEEIPSGG